MPNSPSLLRRPSRTLTLLAGWLALVAMSCTREAPTPTPTSGPDITPTTSDPSSDPTPDGLVTDPLYELATGRAQWAALCARGHADSVAEAFCEGGEPPIIASFAALRTYLGLGGDDLGGESLRVTAVHHSSALGGRNVTPLNPRAFFFTPPRGTPDPEVRQPDERYTVVAFARGETVVELVSRDPVTEEPRFYLFRFTPPCDSDPEGCGLADLLLPGVEAGWTDWSLYDDGDLANTTFDCLRCHQPSGPQTPRLLLMQEIGEPWNHWFYEEVDANIAAIGAFEQAHADASYADLPAERYTRTRPRSLQALVLNNNPVAQPNRYDSAAINEELDELGTSPTWEALSADAALGMPAPALDNPHVQGVWDDAVPYRPVLLPSPLADAIAAYRGVAEGDLLPNAMPDPRDLWSPEALVDTRRVAPPGLDGPELLEAMCSACHNRRLDPTVSRARFDVEALSVLSTEVKNRAIERLLLPPDDVRYMPPARSHALTDAERDLVIATLSE